MKKLIVLASLLVLGALSSYAGSWGLSSFNGAGPNSGSVTVPTAGTFVMQAYVTSYGFAVVSFDNYTVTDYNGYAGSKYQTGSLVAGTYNGSVSTTGSGTSATLSVSW